MNIDGDDVDGNTVDVDGRLLIGRNDAGFVVGMIDGRQLGITE